MPDCYEFDGFLLDVREARVMRGNEPVKLTAKSFSVLTLLVERAPNVVSRAEFEANVWPEGFVDPGNLTQTIYMVRKALGEGDAPIETVNGRGYRLSTTVRAIRASESRANAFSEAHELIDADHASSEEPSAVRRVLTSFQHAIGRGRRTTVALFAIASAAGTMFALSFLGHR